MRPPFTILPRAISLGLALTSLAAVSAARPAAAQKLVYTLSGVIFNDGATAGGSFEFDGSTNTFGNLDILSTNGITDTLIGAHYVTGDFATTIGGGNVFKFNNVASPRVTPGVNSLVLDIAAPAVYNGVYLLRPGSLSQGGFSDSGELAPLGVGARVVTAGAFIVSGGAPVPEASTTASFGLLLALGMGGLVIAAKRKKAASSL